MRALEHVSGSQSGLGRARAAACCLATACTRMSSEMMQHIQTLLIMT